MDENKSKGEYKVDFEADGLNLSSGVYFVRVNYRGTGKVIKSIYFK